MNAYVSVDELKSAMTGFSGTGTDADILRAIEDASRWAEGFCNGRRFYSEAATRYFDGDGTNLLQLMPPDDLISVTALEVDTDLDDTFEEMLTADTEYRLLPHTRKTGAQLEVWTRQSGPITVWPEGRRTVKVTGLWGYSDDVESAGTLGAAISDTAGTSVTMTSGHLVKIGDTIRIDAEDLYVTNVATDTLTVKRGVNGTTAATHTNGAAVSRRLFPADVKYAVLMEASRTWREGQVGFSGQIANPSSARPAWLRPSPRSPSGSRTTPWWCSDADREDGCVHRRGEPEAALQRAQGAR